MCTDQKPAGRVLYLRQDRGDLIRVRDDPLTGVGNGEFSLCRSLLRVNGFCQFDLFHVLRVYLPAQGISVCFQQRQAVFVAFIQIKTAQGEIVFGIICHLSDKLHPFRDVDGQFPDRLF